jgi:hypothetical protein
VSVEYSRCVAALNDVRHLGPVRLRRAGTRMCLKRVPQLGQYRSMTFWKTSTLSRTGPGNRNRLLVSEIFSNSIEAHRTVVHRICDIRMPHECFLRGITSSVKSFDIIQEKVRPAHGPA